MNAWQHTPPNEYRRDAGPSGPTVIVHRRVGLDGWFCSVYWRGKQVVEDQALATADIEKAKVAAWKHATDTFQQATLLFIAGGTG